MIKIALPEIINRFAFTSTQYQENDSFDNIIALKRQEEGTNQVCELFSFTLKQIFNLCFQEQDQLLQEITASGIVSAEFDYAPNPLILSKDETFLAFVSNIDKRNHFIYMQPECYMEYMEKLTEQLE